MAKRMGYTAMQDRLLHERIEARKKEGFRCIKKGPQAFVVIYSDGRQVPDDWSPRLSAVGAWENADFFNFKKGA